LFPYAGEVFALLSAFIWAFAFVLFRKSGENIPPLALNLFKNILALILFVPTFLAVPQLFSADAGARDYGILAISGILGITVADTLFFYSLNRLGAGLSAIVDCLYSPSVVVFAYVLLRERITAWDAVGACLILSAISIASLKIDGKSRKSLVVGILMGMSAMVVMALGIVIAKPVLDRTPVLWASLVRVAAATVTLGLCFSVLPRKHSPWKYFGPSAHWRTSVPASILGGFGSMILWVAGMKYTLASIAAIMNQMTTIFVVLLAAPLLREPLTGRKLAAVALAIAGVLMVTLL
jgi:drug/metabolite transporter (DMT)-like permease